MARIRVYRSEADGENFPRICMRCGQPSDLEVAQTFAWMPSWVRLFILMGLLPWLIASLVMRKSMHVVVPMCRAHASHWRMRKLYVWLGLLFWFALFVALIMFARKLPDQAIMPVVAVSLVAAFFWLIGGLILMNGAIKPAEIRERGMELVNVNKAFAREWNDMDD